MVAQLVAAPHPILACADEVRDAVAEVRDSQPVYMTPAEQTTAVVELGRAINALQELQLRVVAAAGTTAQEAAARHAGAWLAHHTRADVPAARADARLAEALDRRWTRLAAGMADGAVSVAQAHVVVHALEALPADLDPDLVADAETQLVEWCEQFRPAELRRLGRRILEVVAPDIAEAEAPWFRGSLRSHLNQRRVGG